VIKYNVVAISCNEIKQKMWNPNPDHIQNLTGHLLLVLTPIPPKMSTYTVDRNNWISTNSKYQQIRQLLNKLQKEDWFDKDAEKPHNKNLTWQTRTTESMKMPNRKPLYWKCISSALLS